MSFWKNASDALSTGVQLGVRAQDRAEDREERRLDREQRKEQWEASNKRAEAAEARQQEEFDEKKQFKVVTKLFNSAHSLYQAGVEANDDGMIRQGAQKLVDTYNQYLPNGDETRIIFKKDSASDPVMQAKWDEDQNLKGKEVAILSKSGGIMPFKNLDDAFNYAAANLNMENFTAGAKAAKAKVAELNAKEEPFMGNDGQYYTRRWKMGKGGMPEKSDPIPYTGVTKASKTKQDVVETEQVLGRKLKSGEVGVKAGLTKAEGASEAAKNYAQAEKARAEGKAAAAEGKTPRMKKADLDAAKASLDMLLRPFVSKGQPILDPETGEMTQAADNGLKVAGQLIDKYKEDPKSLTKEERRNLPHAVRAWEVYKSISASVTAGHISPEQAARMAEGEGTPSNYKDGNWHVVPSGEHKGKEARYNSEKKKFEIRARGGASASFDSGAPRPAAAGLTPPGYGNRADGTPKGEGFLGELNRPDGGVSTELSIGVNLNGKETEIPLLVPTLTQGEIDHLLGGGEPTKEIVQKAVDHAKARMSEGKSPFAGNGEARREPTAAEENARRAGLVAAHAGVGREEDALTRYIRSDKDIPPFEGEPAYGGGLTDMLGRPVARVMEDYEEQKRRAGR